MHVFDTLDYLKSGNFKQQAAYRTLTAHSIFIKLQAFSPILTGTIPINIDTDNSDMDIACYWKDKAAFRQVLTNEFNKYKLFTLNQKLVNNIETIICSFSIDNFTLEIFGQNRPSREQESYRHMLIESEILKTRGENFRKEIIQLKKAGHKTEPAFAKLLALEGDPYEAILNFKMK